MGQMNRAVAREQSERDEYERKVKDRFASTIVIGACIIAAVKLAREENVSKPSPRVLSVVSDAIGLARMILDRVIR
jgi:hypothetical protein